ncbi:MAG: SurA N-terminal domain-containing protein [Pyrinomonadaceae bacterium]|nr:SurA N-terminal domain-containing protein [Pyrinomonadaceae bacterium]
MQRFAIYIVVVALAAFALACNNRSGASTPGAAADNAVAATVNGKNIMLSEVDKLIALQAQGQQDKLSPLALAQARLQVLDGLIQNEVLLQRAEKEKIVPTEVEITNYINERRQGMTEEQFQKALKDQGLTMDSLKEEARKTIAIQKLRDNVAGKIGAPSDKEVEDFYNNNKQMFVTSRGVELAMIAADPDTNEGLQDDAKSEAEAKQKIDLIAQQLKNEDFADVARKRSEDQSAYNGGDIGFASEAQLKQNGFPQELISQFFDTLAVGSYTAPVRFASPQFPNGRWYIFKLKRKQLQSENLTLDNPAVRQQIVEGLTSQRKQLLLQAFVQVAMTDAKIVNNLAKNMVDNPSNLSGLRPANAGGTSAPAQNTNAQPQNTNTAPAATANTNTSANKNAATQTK